MCIHVGTSSNMSHFKKVFDVSLPTPILTMTMTKSVLDVRDSDFRLESVSITTGRAILGFQENSNSKQRCFTEIISKNSCVSCSLFVQEERGITKLIAVIFIVS